MENEYNSGEEDIVDYEDQYHQSDSHNEKEQLNSEHEDVNDTLLNLELQISEDKTDILKIRENDDTNEVVDKFCSKYGYGKKVKNMIMERLVEALNSNISESIFI
jgi:hypothetical protein